MMMSRRGRATKAQGPLARLHGSVLVLFTTFWLRPGFFVCLYLVLLLTSFTLLFPTRSYLLPLCPFLSRILLSFSVIFSYRSHSLPPSLSIAHAKLVCLVPTIECISSASSRFPFHTNIKADGEREEDERRRHAIIVTYKRLEAGMHKVRGPRRSNFLCGMKETRSGRPPCTLPLLRENGVNDEKAGDRENEREQRPAEVEDKDNNGRKATAILLRENAAERPRQWVARNHLLTRQKSDNHRMASTTKFWRDTTEVSDREAPRA